MRIIDQQLIEACKNGDALTTEKLLFRGADPNARANEWPYRTALLIATEYGHLKIITTLIQHGADPHIQDWANQTALHYAVEKQYHNIAQYLITTLKLDPNSQDQHGVTPFMIAAARGDIPMLQLLVRHGADPNITSYHDENALHYAVQNRFDDIVQYLLTHTPINLNIKNRSKQTPFLLAARNGDIDMLQLLIQHGADPHIQDWTGQTALHYAVEKHHYKAVEYLITQLHINPNSRDYEGFTPFLLAAKKGDIPMLQLLVQHGANPHITNKFGRNALYYAIKNQHHDIAQYLLTQLHLDPNHQDRYGDTPFMIAAEIGNIKMLQLLAQHGANPHIQGAWKKTALHHAVENQHHDIAQYLLTQLKVDPNTQDNNGNTPFMIAAQKGDIKMLRILIQHGANPYVTDKDGQTALHYAIDYRYPDIAQYLLIQLQFDPNTPDKDGIAPLMLAAQKGDIAMIRLLIQNGANPYATDHQGRNALHYAAESEYDNPQETHFLITHLPLDLNQQDHNGNTPLHIALQKGHHDTAQTLIRLGANPHIPNRCGLTPTSIAHFSQIPLEKTHPSTITL